MKRIAVEYPEFMQSVGGLTTARRGDLIKLAILCGMIAGLSPYTRFVPVHEWKGQLPKAVTQNLVRKKVDQGILYRLNPKTSHEFDAIGIGLYLRGEF